MNVKIEHYSPLTEVFFCRVIIDTISELADSKVGIGIWGQQNKGFFQMSEDTSSKLIADRAEHYNDPAEAVRNSKFLQTTKTTFPPSRLKELLMVNTPFMKMSICSRKCGQK